MGKGGVVKKTQGRGRRKRREDREKKGSGKAGKRGLGFGVWGSDLRVGFPRLGLDASYCGVSCITSGRGGYGGVRWLIFRCRPGFGDEDKKKEVRL